MLVHKISNGLMSLMLFMISNVSSGRYLANNPCVLALLFFFIFSGGAPVDLPPCIRQRPFGIAQFLHDFPLLVLAPQRFLFLTAWALFCIYIHTTVLICILGMKKAPC